MSGCEVRASLSQAADDVKVTNATLEGERLQISGDSQRPGVHGFKTDITNQSRRDVVRVLVVPVPPRNCHSPCSCTADTPIAHTSLCIA